MALRTGLVRLRGRLRDALPSHHDDGSETVLFCNAPSASLYLDQRGDVRACCQNAGFPMGNVTERSLREIWDGERAHRLRAAVADGDLSLGCNFCRWQVEEGSGDAVFARMFDHLDPVTAEPQWPQQLELSMSNACNLQCVMCNGEWSSSIRTHREGLPPLPTVYDDAFFDGLADFLPHLKVVKFLGGEPFLGKESLRVMEMLAELGSGIQVHVTTNGTQWSPRIERILDRLDVNVVVSLDGVHQDTYESIRVGSSFESVVTNIDRFVAYTAERGTGFSLSHCLMTANWREFDDFLDFAEERGSEVYVNTVTEPYELSLYHLPPSELRGVVDVLRSKDSAACARLSGERRVVWNDQLERLGHHLRRLEAHVPPDYVARRRQLGFAWIAPPERAANAGAQLESALEHGSGWLVECDAQGRVQRVQQCSRPSERLTTWVEARVHLGDALPAVLQGSTSDQGGVDRHDLRSQRLELDGQEHDVDGFVTWVAVRDQDGIVVGTRILVEDHRAFHAAAALADSSDGLAGYEIDDRGRVSHLDGSVRAVLGVERDGLLGRPARDLDAAIDEALGRRVACDDDAGAGGGIPHVVGRRVDPAGRVTVLHQFDEPSGSSTRYWVVRTGSPAVEQP